MSRFILALLLLAQDEDPAGSERARDLFKRFPSRGELTNLSIPPRAPAETVKSFALAEGLEAEAVLHEPAVRQPVFLNFDERGRMWVVQFIQYPYPAGLKVIDLDHQFHAVYDKVPPPPPYPPGSPFRGKSLVTIHEDTDGDGAFDRHKTFLDGLNMATAVERGRGGVWVLQAPYLLFYPDRDADDRPDADPVVHLEGFGMEDTHSTANSLRWGPDGWLYGGQGSGVSMTIRRTGLDKEGFYYKGQAIWRYHPETRSFELFAEGGGNTYGLEFDAAGRVFSGSNGGNRRGYHFVQGGYYEKGWGEHGYLTNPHAFGYFGSMGHEPAAPRFSHTFVIYEAGALGAAFEGRLIAPVPLHNVVVLAERLPHGSTFRTRDAGTFLSTKDRWFRPVDIKVGPDGAVYIADWYDTRLSHMNPKDTWDKERGRIYRIRAKGAAPSKPFDLAKRSTAELVELLSHRNPWHRRQAIRLLYDRREAAAIPIVSVDSVWARHACGASVEEALGHPDADVRAAAVRILGEGAGSPRLVELARAEPDLRVRSQLASTARRLPAELALPALRELLLRGADDPHLPLLEWWALESFAVSHRDAVVKLFEDRGLWKAGHVVERLARRYAATPTPENQAALARLLKAAPDDAARRRAVKGIQEAYGGRKIEGLLAAIEEALDSKGATDPASLALGVRRGDGKAIAAAMAAVSAGTPGQLDLLQALGDARPPEAAPVLLQVLGRGSPPARAAALASLAQYDDPSIASGILSHWASLDRDLRERAAAVLCRRKSWAKTLLDAAVASGTIPRQDVSDETVDRIRLLGDKDLTALADRYFGRKVKPTSEEKQKEIKALAALLAKGAGDPKAGKPLYAARCGSCHKLFDEGGTVGPDLTGYERTNLENMILSIVDPSAAIREGYVQHLVVTKDERTLVGLIAERDGDRMVLVDARGERTVVPVAQVGKQRMLESSLMPEGLLQGLTPQQLRDLFAYLASK